VREIKKCEDNIKMSCREIGSVTVVWTRCSGYDPVVTSIMCV
jgi:hypothetical protein